MNGALGQDRPTAVAIMSGVEITFTVAFAMKSENMSALLATVVGWDHLVDIVIMTAITNGDAKLPVG